MPQEMEKMGCDLMHVHEAIVEKVTAEMPDEDVLFDLSELFKVFGDSTRIRILYCLFASEMCVCDIATLLNMTQSAISHQLSVLKKSKLVKEGNLLAGVLDESHFCTSQSSRIVTPIIPL